MKRISFFLTFILILGMIFVGGGVIIFFLPTGLSGLQIIASGIKPALINFSRIMAANSGVPQNMNLGL